MKAAEGNRDFVAARLPGTDSGKVGGMLIASPVGGADDPVAQPAPGGIDRAVKGLGRFLFGESKR
jgi:hypothetical protein